MLKNVLEYLEQTAVAFPNKTAAVDEKFSITYQELLEKSKRAGSFLAGKTAINQPVMVFAEKSVNTLCAFFAIAYAGCFYTLADPHLPDQRLSVVRQILRTNLVVTTEEYYERARTLFASAKIYKIEEILGSELNAERLNEVRSAVTDTMPLYVNFTSGSSGTPKGVAVCHRSVIDFINVFCATFEIGESDVIGNQAPFDFDVSVKDIYSAVKTGAKLVMIPKKYFSRPTDLMDFIVTHHITTLIWAVSALSLINTFHILDYKTPETVNKVFFSGESMPIKHLKDWQAHLPRAKFVNLYGPTEVTCNCTYHVVDHKREYHGTIPIGKAFDNERVMLLDENNCGISQPNLVGEICVSGTALALGYFNNPEQTQKAFVQNPLNPEYNDLMYRTGDLAKFDENMDLVFCGRKDFQIKYLGHRVELEGVETEIMKIEGVEKCCCVFDEEKKRLYAFYIGSIDKTELYHMLRMRLPSFMVPTALRRIEKMPLTKNGKTDRRALFKGEHI